MNKARWLALMDKLGFVDNLATFEKLQANYQQRNRHYHNSQHIDAMLRHLDEVSEWVDDPLALELAVYFHDAIYRIFSATNEQDSADMAVDFLTKNSVNETFITKVHDLILVTLHAAVPLQHDERVMVDMDLSILGCSERGYQDFENRVRREYRMIPSFIYRKKRVALLTQFLQRPRIYSHDYCYEKFEAPARINLANAIKQLA